jgi:hypothetical protein
LASLVLSDVRFARGTSMKNFHTSALILGMAVAFTAMSIAACSDDPANSLGRRPGGPGGSGNVDGSGDPNNDPNAPPYEEQLFRAIEAEVDQKCGLTCHKEGSYRPEPPTFLEGPDAYKSIKSYPGIVTRDVYASTFLTKGPHAGPSVDSATDPEFYEKVRTWLEAEALAIQSQRLPSTDPITITSGANDVDLSKACVGGLTGVRLKFNASLVAGMLSLDDLTVVAPAGTDVHVYKPRFVRVLAQEVDGQTEFADPADSFSNTDQTVPGGAETILAPGSVLFSGAGWRPYDFAADKIRIEAEKIQPGKVSVIDDPNCRDVPLFVANVLPALRGNGFAPNCQGCHGNGLAGLNLGSNDTTLICNQVRSKLNPGNIAQSIMVTKVSPGAQHNGGQVDNPQAWAQVFSNNAAAFFDPQ